MSFTGAPVSRCLVAGLIASSMAASLFNSKHYFYIILDTHIWRYHQVWRFFSFQLCYTNSAEVLFACMVLYHMRVIERLFGSRKYLSFLVVTYLLTSIVTPITMLFLSPLTNSLTNYLPAGLTPTIFAILAQFHAIVPRVYLYRIAAATSSSSNEASTPESFQGITLSDKSIRYFLALQLSVMQWPGSLIGAVLGWIVGHSWRSGIVPESVTRWRVPGWMVGMHTQKRREEFEGLRRRLEDENNNDTAAASSSGIQTQQQQGGDGAQRRTMGERIFDQLQGALP